MKRYAVKDNSDDTKIVVIRKSYTPNEYYGILPDSISKDDEKFILMTEEIVIELGIEVTKVTFSVDEVAKANSNEAKSRELKLSGIRSQRSELLKEMNYMATDVALGSRIDGPVVAQYKSDLLDVTNPYKDIDGKGTAALDSVEEDLSNFVFPAKP